jgi:hypothetical protein
VNCDSDVQDAIERLRSALEENRQLHRNTAPSFSAFDALFPDENALSRVLAYLFDKKAGHGQGTDFLELFLKLIKCDWSFDDSHVQTEYHFVSGGNGRRIDVLITLGDGFRIAIENKARWAAEQRDQCRDYCRELERLSPARWLLIYLTPDGRPPKTCGEYEIEIDRRIKRLRFDNLADALTTECERLRPFLADLQRFVREHVNEEPPLHAGENKMMDKLLEPENIGVTVEIMVRIRDVRKRLLRRFEETMLDRIRNAFGDAPWQAGFRGIPEEFDRTYSGIYFFKPAWKDLFAIGFSNQEGDAKSVIFGVFYWDRVLGKNVPGRIADGRLREKLNRALGNPEKESTNWDWFRYLDRLGMPTYLNWHDADVIRRMALDGGRQMVDDLFPLVEVLIEIGEKDIDEEARLAGSGDGR